jgi:superfamily II DNA/RNA helicase
LISFLQAVVKTPVSLHNYNPPTNHTTAPHTKTKPETPNQTHNASLETELEMVDEKRAIVFVNTKRQCDNVYAQLEGMGFRCVGSVVSFLYLRPLFVCLLILRALSNSHSSCFRPR